MAAEIKRKATTGVTTPPASLAATSKEGIDSAFASKVSTGRLFSDTETTDLRTAGVPKNAKAFATKARSTKKRETILIQTIDPTSTTKVFFSIAFSLLVMELSCSNISKTRSAAANPFFTA